MWKQAQYLQMKEHSVLSLHKYPFTRRSDEEEKRSRSLDQIARTFSLFAHPPKNVSTSRHWSEATDVFISCLDSHSDGTHSLLNKWCNPTFLQIWCGNKLILILDCLRVSTFSANFHFWMYYSFKHKALEIWTQQNTDNLPCTKLPCAFRSSPSTVQNRSFYQFSLADSQHIGRGSSPSVFEPLCYGEAASETLSWNSCEELRFPHRPGERSAAGTVDVLASRNNRASVCLCPGSCFKIMSGLLYAIWDPSLLSSYFCVSTGDLGQSHYYTDWRIGQNVTEKKRTLFIYLYWKTDKNTFLNQEMFT